MRMWAPKDVNQASECLVLPNAPACMQGGWTRVNHLGNGRDGVPLNITWRIPYFPSNTTKLAVLRVRYVCMHFVCVYVSGRKREGGREWVRKSVRGRKSVGM